MYFSLNRSIWQSFAAVSMMLVLATVLPITLWLRQRQLTGLFADPYSSLTTIAQVSGLVGICLLSINIILSGRYFWADRLFYGLDRAYRIHRRTGLVAFSLILTHALALSLRAVSLSSSELTPLWLSLDDPALIFGRLSLLGFISIILITLYRRLPYHWLKRIHQTLGFFLLLSGLHVYLVPSDVAFNQPLRWYILALLGLGIISYLWRTLFKRWLVPRYQYTVTAVDKLTSNTTQILMSPVSPKQLKHQPGQFAFFRFSQPNFSTEDHPYTISTHPGSPHLGLVAKAVGDYSAKMSSLKPGATAYIQGPYGTFSYVNFPDPQIWIAGGIGITPFMSMARDLASHKSENNIPVVLIHSVATPADAVFSSELRHLAATLPLLTYHLWITKVSGYLTATSINRLTTLANKDILLCGPPSMIAALNHQLQTLGVPSRRIHSEHFNLL